MRAFAGSVRMMVLGGTVLFASWLLLLFLTIRLLTPGLPLLLFAYAGSVVGLTIGAFGALQHARRARRP